MLTGARLALDDARDAADAAGAPVARGSKFVAVARTRKQFAAVSRELNAIFFEFPFTVPEYFALITRALLVLEGIALSGIPEFDIFQAAYPHALARASAMSGELPRGMCEGWSPPPAVPSDDTPEGGGDQWEPRAVRGPTY